MLFLAWRCLYAEIVQARIEGKPLNFKKAYKRLTGLLLARVQAYGFKWRRWVLRKRNTQAKSTKYIPEKHQTNVLISMDKHAVYTIHPQLKAEYEKAMKDM